MEDSMKKIIGEKIKENRQKLNLTQEELAKELDVSTGIIPAYERGLKTPSDKIKIKLCGLFNISFNDLMGYDTYKHKINNKKFHFLKKDLSKEQENSKLYNKILEKQGDLLYTTLSEECAELIQACSKIQRKKYYGEGFEIDNLLEEINDVELNIKLIKKQLTREPSLNITEDEINEQLQKWDKKKTQKLTKIFLEKGEKENG